MCDPFKIFYIIVLLVAILVIHLPVSIFAKEGENNEAMDEDLVPSPVFPKHHSRISTNRKVVCKFFPIENTKSSKTPATIMIQRPYPALV